MSDQRHLYPKLIALRSFLKLMYYKKSGSIKSCFDKDIIQVEYWNIWGNIIHLQIFRAVAWRLQTIKPTSAQASMGSRFEKKKSHVHAFKKGQKVHFCEQILSQEGAETAFNHATLDEKTAHGECPEGMAGVRFFTSLISFCDFRIMKLICDCGHFFYLSFTTV